MSRLIAIITVLHVLAHSVFGCCGHNVAHTASVAHCCHSVNEEVCSHQSEHGLRIDQQESDAGAFPLLDSNSPALPHHACLHSSCQWLNSKSLGPADVLRGDVNSTVAVAPTALNLFVWPTVAAALSDLPDFGNSALPLRLHLMLGVLQI